MTGTEAAPLAAHPDRVRAAIDRRINDATIERLLACNRLRERLVAHLEADGEATSDIAEAEQAAWLLDDPRRAAMQAGAILHAAALRDVVSAPAVERLVAAIGSDAHALGLRHAAEAVPRANDGDLAKAIERDGLLLLGAWLSDGPAPLRRAALLRLPPGTAAETEEADPELRQRAIVIMNAVRDGDAADKAAAKDEAVASEATAGRGDADA